RAYAGLVQDGPVRARVGDIARDLVEELLERMRPTGCQPPLAVAVAVDVRDRFLCQLRLVLLGPLGGSEQSPLLTIPEREDEGPARLPTRFQQLAKRACRLEERRRAARRIRRAIHPRVMMVAVEHPFVRERN